MQVAFWSNYHQTGTTCNLVAVSAMIILEYRLKVLMTHNHFDRSALETSFIDRDYVKNELSSLNDVGIDALSSFIKYNKVDKDNISRYTTTIIKNKLELLVGTSITNKDLYMKDINEVIDIILTHAKSYYDLIFVDVAPGQADTTKKIFEHSDLIVVNLNQNYNIIEDFFEKYSEYKDQCVFLLGKYDRNSRFNAKALQRKFGIKSNIGVVPYNIEFSDACCEAKAIDFIMRNLKAGKDDINYYFIQEVRKTVELILKKLNVDISLKKIGD